MKVVDDGLLGAHVGEEQSQVMRGLPGPWVQSRTASPAAEEPSVFASAAVGSFVVPDPFG